MIKTTPPARDIQAARHILRRLWRAMVCDPATGEPAGFTEGDSDLIILSKSLADEPERPPPSVIARLWGTQVYDGLIGGTHPLKADDAEAIDWRDRIEKAINEPPNLDLRDIVEWALIDQDERRAYLYGLLTQGDSDTETEREIWLADGGYPLATPVTIRRYVADTRPAIETEEDTP